MAEQVKITIVPSVSDANLLTVTDAMQQVLDLFALLSAAETAKKGKSAIVWRLISATTNSPFNVVGEAYAVDPAIIMDVDAMEAKRDFQSAMNAVIAGQPIPTWAQERNAEATLRKVFKRNLNGIGRTDVDLGQGIDPIIIAHRSAGQAVRNLDLSVLNREGMKEDFTHTAYGSLEGIILAAGTFYNKPCFHIRERLSGREIRCVISGALADEIGKQHDLSEVWKHKRVLVEGRIAYDTNGYVINIDATNMKTVEHISVPVEAFIDPHFTGGLSPTEYLKRFREGEFDQ